MTDLTAKQAWEEAREGRSITAIAREVGVSPQAVWQWDVVPPKRVLAVEKLTGVSRYRLRPDLYGTDGGGPKC